MVQKHSELKEAFTYFKAIEKLVSKFNTTYKARIDCINKMLLDKSNKHNKIKEAETWQNEKKESITNLIKSIEGFYGNATNGMHAIKNIADNIKTKEWTQQVDHTSGNILNNSIKPMLDAISDLLKDEKKRNEFKLEIQKLASNNSKTKKSDIAQGRDKAKNKVKADLQNFMHKICVIITESDAIKKEIDRQKHI